MKSFESLADKLRFMIERDGPIPLTQYFHQCLSDPQFGYYQRKQAIGAGGDFITAPEISQLFGELIGVWCVSVWQQLGKPAPFMLVEGGPGRGTLMADMLRVIDGQDRMREACHVHLIETNAAMRQQQVETLRPFSERISIAWHTDMNSLPPLPMVFVANELLDAMPARQYVKTDHGWCEVGIGLSQNETGGLTRLALAAQPDEAILPAGAAEEPAGSVFEHAPAREAFVHELASRMARHGGAALLIDYGHTVSGFGDTFQAVANHGFADPMEAPGNHDLTFHVDFDRLLATARDAGLKRAAITTQGDFLLALGILERAGQLGAPLDAEGREKITAQVHRLAHPNGMGTLFKVLGLCSIEIELPGFADRDNA